MKTSKLSRLFGAQRILEKYPKKWSVVKKCAKFAKKNSSFILMV